tara:strand:+ start:7872 stop:8612 length:741 start_codon:yes stop_codon:yes gene_type:complete
MAIFHSSKDASAVGSGIDYSQWIRLQIADASEAFDTSSIVTATQDLNGVQFAVTGTASSSFAWWAFEPKDSTGNVVDLGRFGIVIWISFSGLNQPTPGSDAGIMAGIQTGTGVPFASDNGYALGAQWDAAGNGPDLISASSSSFNATGTSDVDANGVLQIRLNPPLWHKTGDEYRPAAGSGCEWLGPDGDKYEHHRTRGVATTNVDLGTDTSLLRFFLGVSEGSAATTFKCQIHYKIYPANGDAPS